MNGTEAADESSILRSQKSNAKAAAILDAEGGGRHVTANRDDMNWSPHAHPAQPSQPLVRRDRDGMASRRGCDRHRSLPRGRGGVSQ